MVKSGEEKNDRASSMAGENAADTMSCSDSDMCEGKVTVNATQTQMTSMIPGSVQIHSPAVRLEDPLRLMRDSWLRGVVVPRQRQRVDGRPTTPTSISGTTEEMEQNPPGAVVLEATLVVDEDSALSDEEQLQPSAADVIHAVAAPESHYVRRFVIMGRAVSINVAVALAFAFVVGALLVCLVAALFSASSSRKEKGVGPPLTLSRVVDILIKRNITDLTYSRHNNETILNVNANLTSQEQALRWLTEKDSYVISPDDEDKIVQRYVLSVLYFATVGTVLESDLASEAEGKSSQQPLDSTNAGLGETEKNGNVSSSEYFFLSPTDECLWDGVVCNTGRGAVSQLDLSYAGLTGTIPSEIGHLEDLTQLYFTDNALQGIYRPRLVCFATLKSLSFLEMICRLLSRLNYQIFRI